MASLFPSTDSGQILHWPLRAAVSDECSLSGGTFHAGTPSFPGAGLCQALKKTLELPGSKLAPGSHCWCTQLEASRANKNHPPVFIWKWTAECIPNKTVGAPMFSPWPTVCSLLGRVMCSQMKGLIQHWPVCFTKCYILVIFHMKFELICFESIRDILIDSHKITL